jgi:hypothetical protein
VEKIKRIELKIYNYDGFYVLIQCKLPGFLIKQIVFDKHAKKCSENSKLSNFYMFWGAEVTISDLLTV